MNSISPQPFDLAAYGSQRVAVVIMARDEERTVDSVVRDALPFAHEVVVMDGRSTDRTAELARAAGATVHADPGRGKGSAVRLAMQIVACDVLVFMDSDGSHDARDIPRLALPVVRGETELCVGSRFTGGSEELSVNVGQLVRTIGNISMNIAINTRWGTELTDTLNGFRAVRRGAALEAGLVEDRHTIEQEMVLKVLRRGGRVMNVPAHEFKRRFGTSHIRVWREWPVFVWCLARNLVLRRVRP